MKPNTRLLNPQFTHDIMYLQMFAVKKGMRAQVNSGTRGSGRRQEGHILPRSHYSLAGELRTARVTLNTVPNTLFLLISRLRKISLYSR